MKLRSHRALAACSALLLAGLVSAQDGARLTLQALFERGAALTPRTPAVLWLPGGHDATLVVTAEDLSQTLHRVVQDEVEPTPLCSARDVLDALGVAAGDGPARFPAMAWQDRDTLRIEHENAIWTWEPGDAKAEQVLAWPAPDQDAGFGEPMVLVAPGDEHAAVRKDHQLWLAAKGGALRQITWDGSADVVYGSAAHRAEFGITQGLFWSPDGRFLAFYREDQRSIAPYPYQDLGTTKDGPAMPAPRPGRYPMAGRAHGKTTVGVCDMESYAVVWLEHDRDQDLYWTNLTFAPDGGLCVALVDRGQTHMELVRFDAKTGRRERTLLHEHDAEWIEPEHGPTFFPDGSFLWWSRRDGWKHLWLCADNGALIAQVTKGAFDVQAIHAVAKDASTVWFAAAGDDARQLHLFAAPLPGTTAATGPGQRRITGERGTHQVSLSPDGERAFAVWSNLEQPPSARLVDTADGRVVAIDTPADPSLAFALPQQRFFEVAAKDGATLYGHVALPPDLREGERRPVLLYVYGGPHAQLVKDEWLGGLALWLQALAGEGFVVCRLDNHGTPNRGEQFEQAVHRRLGTLEVEDQLLAVDWLTRQPYVDARRIGVHGWSFGGYMTLRLMLLAPEVFACGVSGAPVTDWAMYETGYGERYMDTPAENPDGYRASSVLPLAKQLKRPLLVVHGTDDRTVVWSHTLDFVDACIDAGVAVDYFVYPMQLHGLRGRDRGYFLRQLRAYLVRHLRPEDRGAVEAVQNAR